MVEDESFNRDSAIPTFIIGISLWYDPSTNLDYAYADTSIGKLILVIVEKKAR